RALDFGMISALFRLCLTILSGALPVLLIGATLWLWQRGQASTGDIVAAGTIAIRIAQMTGWVSFTLRASYYNIGEIEDGMKTLTLRRRRRVAPPAPVLEVPHGAIVFDNVSLAYGRGIVGVHNLDLVSAAGEKLGLGGASGAGKSALVSLLLRLYLP